MDKNAKIYIAGHRGMVGSAIGRQLEKAGYTHLIGRTRTELDLTDAKAVDAFFTEIHPQYIFLAAAKVGGIIANNSYPAEFITQNLQIQTNVTIWGTGTPRREFLFADDLGAACMHVMNLPDEKFVPLCAQERNDGVPPLINIGYGSDVTIRELATLIAKTVGFKGEILHDTTKPDGTPRKLMDSSRLTSLGWRAQVALQDGLKRAYTDFKQTHNAN